jgi:hypothetical protein
MLGIRLVWNVMRVMLVMHMGLQIAENPLRQPVNPPRKRPGHKTDVAAMRGLIEGDSRRNFRRRRQHAPRQERIIAGVQK